MTLRKTTTNTRRFVSNKAQNILSTKIGDITVGSSYFWLIIIAMLANLFTFLIGWGVAKMKGIGLDGVPMHVKLPSGDSFY